MKNVFKILGFIALTAVIGFSFVTCDNDDGGGSSGCSHEWGGDVVTAPTCEAAGFTTQTCSKCSTTQQINPSSAIGHDGNWATYTSGSGLRNCQRGNGCSATVGVGDTGPAGGKIIYANATAISEYNANYLEAATSNQETTITWCTCNLSSSCDVTTGTAIGTGKANTAAIIAATHPGGAITASNCAAKVCDEYNNGGKNDWFLPSKDELNEMYKARNHLGTMSDYYWSSSLYERNFAERQEFKYGSQYRRPKSDTFSVRAIRAF